MPVLEWQQIALADLLTIVDCISDDNPDAAQQLKDDIEEKASKLLLHPKSIAWDGSPVRERWLCVPTTWWFTRKMR